MSDPFTYGMPASDAMAALNQLNKDALAAKATGDAAQGNAAIAAQAAQDAAGSAITAGQAAAAATTKAAAAQDAATAAAGSATAAGISAGQAGQSATAAGNSATAAAGSATNAATQAAATAANAANVTAVNTTATNAAAAAAGSATQAASAKDAAIAAWQASTAPAERLAAFSQSIHFGAIVRAFLYDTSKDSDGGAWRKRCLHTSWYNEAIQTGSWRGQLANLPAAWAIQGAGVGDYYQNTTDGKFYAIGGTSAAPTQAEIFRGSAREFPALTAIIATGSRIVIYDLTQSGGPMWMVFGNTFGGTISGLYALNGELMFTTGERLIRAQTVRDSIIQHHTSPAGRGSYGNIAARNTTPIVFILDSSIGAIVNTICNDVAATVLPGAPVEPATGLPVPTIAVATAGGVTAIKHDGTVANFATSAWSHIAWLSSSLLFGRRGGSANVNFQTFEALTYPALTSVQITSPSTLQGTVTSDTASQVCTLPVRSTVANGTSTGLSLLQHNPATPTKGMVAYITNAYNSGWQVGDIRGAWLADTVAEVVIGAELVTNGIFAVDTSSWTAANGATLAVVAGELQLTSTGQDYPSAQQVINGLVVGRSYTLSATARRGTCVSNIAVGVAGINSVQSPSGINVSLPLNFTATATSHVIFAQIVATAANGQTAYFDNISIKTLDADRSVKGKGPTVNGSITKVPVAAGAQLVCYSGFSAANYLEQPYNSDLDFGSGDFCVAGWCNQPVAGTMVPFSRSTVGNTPSLLAIVLNPTKIDAYAGTGAATISYASAPPVNAWTFLCLIRRAGTLYLYLNGIAVAQGASVANLTDATAKTALGVYNFTNPPTVPFNGTLALWRATATAPSEDQIAQMYRDELALFQPSAKCTIDGTSNGVTALAYDDTADLLHVGTTWGRSAFRGLQRIESSATSVGAITTLAAAQGAHITGGASSGRYVQPAMLLRDELRRRDDARRAMAREEIPFEFDSIAAQTAFQLPIGYTTKNVLVAGTKKRLGSTKDYTVAFDGYRETVNFGVSPGATWVQITANRSI
jgi:hypothetical protein